MTHRYLLKSRNGYEYECEVIKLIIIDVLFQNSVVVSISAETFFGVRHGLESLSQLIEFNIVTSLYQVSFFVNIAGNFI